MSSGHIGGGVPRAAPNVPLNTRPVTTSAAPHVSPAELRDHADAVMGSLRRLDAGGPRGAEGGKPWWKIW